MLINDIVFDIKGDELIQFINFVNCCCEVIEDYYVANWISKPHENLDMKTPFELFKEGNVEPVFDLLTWIEHDEADA